MFAEILIIGAGPAGLSAAKAAVKAGKKAVLAGDELLLPYWRPRLPEILRTGADAGSILMQPESWYRENGVLFLPSKRAVKIDPQAKTVVWEDGGTDRYGALILACGSSPNLPKVPFAEKVLPFRSFDDAQRIRRECARTGKLFVVGGGVLGLETAFAAAQTGAHVAVYDLSDYPLPRQLDREGGLFLKKQLSEKGVAIFGGGPIENLREEIEGACVVAAAGVRPQTSLAKAAGLACGRGILVDQAMRTSAPGMFACGDAAEFAGTVPGLMPVAKNQGETAGANAAGVSAVYTALLPSPMTKVAGIPVLSVGRVAADEGVRFFRRTRNGAYAAAAVRNGKIVGAAFVGDVSPGAKFKKLVETAADAGDADSFDALASL